jgi:AraC-like DNA-binding protein
VERILLCEQLVRPETGHHGRSSSRPGHLLQLTTQGEADHEIGGRRHRIRPGHLVWFHEDEPVAVRVRRAPWRLYTLNFLAPTLPPPAFENRVHRAGPALRRRFEALHARWHEPATPRTRALRAHAALQQLLAELLEQLGGDGAEGYDMDEAAALWWRLETALRADLSRPLRLSDLVAESGRSPATVARACHAAVGEPPMQRIKRIRMSMARGLLRYGDLEVRAVAERVGYGRPHELARDHKRFFGKTPREERREARAEPEQR